MVIPAIVQEPEHERFGAMYYLFDICNSNKAIMLGFILVILLAMNSHQQSWVILFL